jgi:hypothetical protein
MVRNLTSAFEARGAHVLVANSAGSAATFVDELGLAAAVLDSESGELRRTLEVRGIPCVVYTGREPVDGAFDGTPIVRKPASAEEVVALVTRLLHPDVIGPRA